MDVERVVREYLPGVIHLSLATSANNRPWVCEVHFVYDDNLDLYFRSFSHRRHSQELSKNPNVAGSIIETHSIGVKLRGVYFEGAAAMIESEDERKGVINHFKRINVGLPALDEARDSNGAQFYRIKVSDWYVFDTREFNGKYHLAWPKPD